MPLTRTRTRHTAADARATVDRLAADAFKDHRLTTVREGLWKCARPERWTYGFFVATLPGAIVTYGDTPDALLRVHGADEGLLAWLRGAVKSPHYLFEKLVNHEAYRTFYADDAVQQAKAWQEGDAPGSRDVQFYEAVQEDADAEDLHQHRWVELVSEYGIDDAYGVGAGWDARAWWVQHALATFVRLHDAAHTGL